MKRNLNKAMSTQLLTDNELFVFLIKKYFKLLLLRLWMFTRVINHF